MKRFLRRILDWFGFTAMFRPGGYEWSLMSDVTQADWSARHRRFQRTFFVAFWLAVIVYASHQRQVSRREANEYLRFCVISVLIHADAGERWLNATIALPTPEFLAQAEVLLGPERLHDLPAIVENRPIDPRSVAFERRSVVIRERRKKLAARRKHPTANTDWRRKGTDATGQERTPEQQAEFDRLVNKVFGPQAGGRDE